MPQTKERHKEYMRDYRVRPDQKEKKEAVKEDKQKEKSEMLQTINETIAKLNPYDFNGLVQLDFKTVPYVNYAEYLRDNPEDSFEEFQHHQASQKEWIEGLDAERKEKIRSAIGFLLENDDPRIHKWIKLFPEWFSKWV